MTVLLTAIGHDQGLKRGKRLICGYVEASIVQRFNAIVFHMIATTIFPILNGQ